MSSTGQIVVVDIRPIDSYSQIMQINLSADQAAQLSELAAQQGKDADELAREVFSRGLAAEAHFIAAVKLGQDAAHRGDFVEQPQVWADIERILQS